MCCQKSSGCPLPAAPSKIAASSSAPAFMLGTNDARLCAQTGAAQRLRSVAACFVARSRLCILAHRVGWGAKRGQVGVKVRGFGVRQPQA